MQHALGQLGMAGEVGFDWVAVGEQRCAPGSLTPNPVVMAAAVFSKGKTGEDRPTRLEHPDPKTRCG